MKSEYARQVKALFRKQILPDSHTVYLFLFSSCSLAWRDARPNYRPSQQRFTAQENAIIEQLMEVILQHGLSADQATTLLGRTIQLLEWGRQSTQEPPQANA